VKGRIDDSYVDKSNISDDKKKSRNNRKVYYVAASVKTGLGLNDFMIALEVIYLNYIIYILLLLYIYIYIYLNIIVISMDSQYLGCSKFVALSYGVIHSICKRRRYNFYDTLSWFGETY